MKTKFTLTTLILSIALLFLFNNSAYAQQWTRDASGQAPHYSITGETNFTSLLGTNTESFGLTGSIGYGINYRWVKKLKSGKLKFLNETGFICSGGIGLFTPMDISTIKLIHPNRAYVEDADGNFTYFDEINCVIKYKIGISRLFMETKQWIMGNPKSLLGLYGNLGIGTTMFRVNATMSEFDSTMYKSPAIPGQKTYFTISGTYGIGLHVRIQSSIFISLEASLHVYNYQKNFIQNHYYGIGDPSYSSFRLGVRHIFQGTKKRY
jgi:hypothetical protein